MFYFIFLIFKIFLELNLINNILSIKLYEYYDVREHYKCDSFNYARNQWKCKRCWTFSVDEVISYRICIDHGGKDQTIVSVTELLTCLRKYRIIAYKGWRGNPMNSGFKYWVFNGLPAESCKPFPFKKKEKIEENL